MKTINTHTSYTLFFLMLLLAAMSSGCAREQDSHEPGAHMLFENMGYPNIYRHDSTYYFVGQDVNISIYAAESIDSLPSVAPVTVLNSAEYNMNNIWSPEITRINGKWYIYFEADAGNTDTHQIYVIENENPNPLEGDWTIHGPIITNEEWNFGIHPSALLVGDKQYLLWSGWEHRRAETETQCIFIAEMENPWTLKSERVLISSPEYEWERQWINPDGTRSAYPIFVNENPEGFLSPDGKNVVVAYSASGIWTPYSALGVLYAAADADLLDTKSWHKLPEPQSQVYSSDNELVGISNISVVNSAENGRSHVLYQAHTYHNGQKYPHIYTKEFSWNSESLPVFGF